MKIFSWVHKTFHHNSARKDGFDSSKLRKAEPDVMKWDNNNNQSSLKEVPLADEADGWKDGFLTIGTLGCYGPFNFKSSDRHKHYLALESDEDEGEKHGNDDEEENKYFDSDEHDEEMMKPLLINVNKFENKFEHVVNEKPNVAKVEALMTTPTPTLVSDDDVVECIDVRTNEKEKKEFERITLSDLFLAESEKIMKHDEAAKTLLLDDDDDKQSLKAKHGQPTFAKELISRVTKDKPHPIKRIRKLMKKMMKKKIHPDVDVQNEKSEEQKLIASEICENQKIEALVVDPCSGVC